MPPDLPDRQQRTSRYRAVAVIERAQQDALRQLRAAGVPETQALLVIQRYAAFALHVLRELDDLYREFEQLLAADPDRSQAHQEWFETRAGGLLLTVDAFIAALVAEASNKAKEDYRTNISQPREVITPAPAQPARSGWQEILWPVVWLAGMLATALVSYQGTGSLLFAGIGFLIPFVLWLKLGRFWWGLLFPLSGIGLEAWILYWLYVSEGGLR
jgi:hypothetical protein